MTRNEFTDLVLTNLGMNSQDRKILPQQVFWTADTVIGELMMAWVKQGGSKSDFAIDVIAEVQKDSKLNLPYVNMEQTSAANQRSVLSVSKIWDRSNPFAIVKAGSIGLYGALEADNLSVPQAWVQSNRLYFKGLGWEVKDVLLVVIPTISKLNDEQDVPVPVELEAELIRRTYQLLSVGVNEDKTNDGRQSIA